MKEIQVKEVVLHNVLVSNGERHRLGDPGDPYFHLEMKFEVKVSDLNVLKTIHEVILKNDTLKVTIKNLTIGEGYDMTIIGKVEKYTFTPMPMWVNCFLRIRTI